MSAIARRLGLDLKTARKSIAQGLVAPTYAQRALRAMVIDQFAPHLSERVAALPEMSGRRSLWEIAGMGSGGGYTSVKDYLRNVRPAVERGYERRFETPAGRQAQVDFARRHSAGRWALRSLQAALGNPSAQASAGRTRRTPLRSTDFVARSSKSSAVTPLSSVSVGSPPCAGSTSIGFPQPALAA